MTRKIRNFKTKTTKKHNKKSQTKRHKKRQIKNKKSQTKRHKKIIKVKKQLGGNFNDKEIIQIKQILKERDMFTEDDINEIVEKLNLSSQRFTGPYFIQLTDQLSEGSFADKKDFFDWLNKTHTLQEESVETDNEYYSEDEEDLF